MSKDKKFFDVLGAAVIAALFVFFICFLLTVFVSGVRMYLDPFYFPL